MKASRFGPIFLITLTIHPSGASPYVCCPLESFLSSSCSSRFYSWRRYCNKHQIRLGAYQMDNNDRSPSPVPLPGPEDEPILESATAVEAAPFPSTSTQQRNRSPTPPRALTRSTTGKGIAFTHEDVNFLVRFLDYRKCVLFRLDCTPVSLIALQIKRTRSGYGSILEGCRRAGNTLSYVIHLQACLRLSVVGRHHTIHGHLG